MGPYSSRSTDSGLAVDVIVAMTLLVLLGHKQSGQFLREEPVVSCRSMTPRSSDPPATSEVYELLRYAAIRRQPVAAIYDGQPRLLCPHVGGWKEGRRNVFCYQFGGRSNSIKPLSPEARVSGVASRWRDSAKFSCTWVIG